MKITVAFALLLALLQLIKISFGQCSISFGCAASDLSTWNLECYGYYSCYRATIPTYAFGEMAMGWASDKDYSGLSLEIIEKRFADAALEMRYYSPEVHKAAFALPVYIKKIMGDQ